MMTDLQPDERALIDGLVRRIRDVLLVAERVGSFSFTGEPSEPTRASLTDEEIDEAARDFVLRALAVSSDPLNHQILTRSCVEGGVTVEQLSKDLGAGALVISERTNDLLQLGLTARALDSGLVRATEAGEAIVAMVDRVAEAIATRIRKGRDDAQRGSGKDGLPLL